MPNFIEIIILFAIFALVSNKSGRTMGTDAIGSSIMDTTNILQDGTVVRIKDQTSLGRGVVSFKDFFARGESNLIIISENAQYTKMILQSAIHWSNHLR